MKNILRKAAVFFVLALILLTQFTVPALAKENLDEIEDYTITVNVREDGTLDIRYDIEWLVLSDKNGSEPVTWVEVGIPNKHVEEVNAITDNIQEAKYYRDGGDCVRVDFNRKYYKGEKFQFSFTIHQSYMYMLEDDAIKYSFTAGWFEEIEIKKITIKWNKNWVEESTATEVSADGKYLVWTANNLPEGEHYSTSVRYAKGTFATDDTRQFEERSSGEVSVGVIVIIIVIAVIVIVLILYFLDDYDGGFGGGGYHSTYISSCARSSCACVSSCACACACAGGGRAGCSAKDMYTGRTAVNKDSPITVVNISVFITVLRRMNK